VFKKNGGGASGTSLPRGDGVPWPVFAVGGGVVVLGLVLWLVLRHGGSAKAAAPQPEQAAGPTTAAPAPTPTRAPTPDDTTPTVAPTAPTGPRPAEVARDLKASLDRQRLWSDVSVQGNAIEVRTSACNDPLMAPTLDAAAATARAAGLAVFRCVSRSGGVVSQRAL
jgi:hypothetical protein